MRKGEFVHIRLGRTHACASSMSETAHAVLEKKQLLEEDLRRVEKQIYELEGEYLQVRSHTPFCK